jgi:hypothetical protein
MRSNLRNAATLAAAVTAMGLITACKQQHSEPHAKTSTPESTARPDSASAIPAAVPPVDATHEPVAEATDSGADRVITVRAVIASMPTQYSAGFSAAQLRYIAETRDATGSVQGRYEFYGARLTRYSGAQLLAPAAVELEFDLQGTLLSKYPGLASSEIEAIKTRAQLLRSHALAQQASRAH